MEARKRIAVSAYLAFDEASDQRHEYWDGFVIAMAGAEPEHNQLKDNIARELGNRMVRKGCLVVTSDQRVQLDTKYVYPDVVLSCNPTFAPTRPQSLLTPELIVEVSSPSTDAIDRRDKLTAYMAIPSLREYWIADPSQVSIHQFIHDLDGWRVIAHTSLDGTIKSDHFDLTLAVRDCYVQVLPTEDEADESPQ